MAQSFWSKRKATIDTAGGYIKAADSVSRPTAVIMTVLGILIVGGLLFGVFTGTKWAYGRLTDNGSTTTQKGTTTTPGPSITATSSTSTTTPSSVAAPTTTAPATPTVAQPTTTPTVVATTATPSKKIPQTGAGSNTALFISVAILGYILHRRRALKS